MDWQSLYVYTANSIKAVLPKALTVSYERARDDGYCLFLLLNSEWCRRNIFEVIQETYDGKFTSYKGNFLSIYLF